MKKSDLWDKVQEVVNVYDFEGREDLIKDLSDLLKPKKRGQNRPESKIIDGKVFYYCRFTGRFWNSEDMVYQNDEQRDLLRDKGYSKIGISLWNKGQKYLKSLKDELTEQILSDKPDSEKVERLKSEIGNISTNNLTNNHKWLVENMTTEDQLKIIESQES